MKPSSVRGRRGYLDWLRGVAVLIMIEAHLLDAWTAPGARESTAFGLAMILGGMGAPLFLFLAGVAVSMSAGSKCRRSGDAAAASRAVVRRGLEIFGLAFLFRLQAWYLGGGSLRGILKVDILNVMGPSIVIAAALWSAGRTSGGRLAACAALTLAVAFSTPLLRDAPFVVALPEPLEAYVRPVPGLTNFVLLPWAAFVFAGAAAGVLLDTARTRGEETRTNLGLGAAGLVLAALAFGASFLPSPYPHSSFWTTSPAFFLLRTGLLTAAIAGAYAWESRPRGLQVWSPLQQLGRTSLFVYWIHVEMVYGVVSRPLHRALSLAEAAGALFLFALFMLVLSLAKDRGVRMWRQHRPAGPLRSKTRPS